MPEFLKLSTPQEAINILLHTLQERKPNFETISTILAMGRVIGKKVLAPHPLPEFPHIPDKQICCLPWPPGTETF